MLTPEEQQAIQDELTHCVERRGAALEALRMVQKHRGYISDASLREIAEYLRLTPDELDGLATFYNLIYRRPVGRHVIHLCDSLSCWMLGQEMLRTALREAFEIDWGQTDAQGRFTLLPNPCLGACDRAPVAMIDGELHFDLKPAGLVQLLRSLP